MPTTTLSSRELHQDAGKAKRAAKQGPVIITDRGRPSFVLLNIDDYHKLAEQPRRSIADALAMPEGSPEFDYEFPRLEFHPRPVDFD
jgi:prevent-host-death family protein